MTYPSALTFERQLTKEVKLYEEYLRILTEERSFITRFNAEKVVLLTEKRGEVLEKISEANVVRTSLCEEFPDGKKTKLTEIIQRYFHGREQAKLLLLTSTLRGLISESQKRTKEFGLITKFGMGVVDSMLSILYSATQHVTKSYSRNKIIQESTTPAGTRDGSVLKKA